jgi:hypothetical protein
MNRQAGRREVKRPATVKRPLDSEGFVTDVALTRTNERSSTRTT